MKLFTLKKLKEKTQKAGFTLVETLVAITILMISVVGPMVFVANGIKASLYSRDQITAFYLAQDAVEALRFLRDNNRIAIVKGGLDPANASSWSTFNNDLSSCTNGTKCGIDTVKVYNLESGSNVISPTLADDALEKTDTGYYGYNNGGIDTKFRRSFTYALTNNNELQITVTITWDSGLTLNRNFTVREDLFYWY